jgi:hypothetical protein
MDPLGKIISRLGRLVLEEIIAFFELEKPETGGKRRGENDAGKVNRPPPNILS